MQAALIAGEQVLVMLMLMAVGFVMYRMKLLSDETCAQLNKLLIVTVTFAVLVSSYNRAFDPVLLRNIGIGLLFATIGHIVGTVLAFIFVHGKGERARGERFACFVSNCGFMGIPLISAFVGPEGVIYASCENSELLSITDRMYVLFDGQIMAELETAKTSEDEIMHYAVGNRAQYV